MFVYILVGMLQSYMYFVTSAPSNCEGVSLAMQPLELKPEASQPSPASLMVASTLITDAKSTEELQKQFGELLDENVILKETLKKNNESMKEQLLMIAFCLEDAVKTNKLHKEKFDATRELVEKLRQENKMLQLEIACLANSKTSANSTHTNKSPECSTRAMSALEFVTSQNHDTINKLSAQLELVDEQRRQPSPASLMVASTLITDDKSTEELQKQFGELLDENVILKHTLKKNYESMKEQFLMIASCQEDMMEAHMLQKEKFNETKDLVDKLRQEKKILIMCIGCLANSEISANTNKSLECSSELGPMSAIEFVTSPDDDTINKLLEKRRQVRQTGTATATAIAGPNQSVTRTASAGAGSIAKATATAGPGATATATATVGPGTTASATATAGAGSKATATSLATGGAGEKASATATAGAQATAIATVTATEGPGAVAVGTATAGAGAKATTTSIATGGAGRKSSATSTAGAGATAVATASAIASATAPPTDSVTQTVAGMATATATATMTAAATATAIA